jgi:enoyl-CoA hydratase/carnithine racemase
MEMGYTQACENGWNLIRLQWNHPDFEEGPRAFAERRDPVWNPDPNARRK